MATRLLERLTQRALLALDCRDRVTGKQVTDGLGAIAWRVDDPATTYTARRSPVSGLLGVAVMRGVVTHARGPAGHPAQWPAGNPPAGPTVVCALVTDRLARYLPVAVSVGVPVATPLVIELDSHPSRPAPGGVATVRGEVHDHTTNEPLDSAVVSVVAESVTFETVSDGLGRFLLYLPWPDALPPLSGSIPLGTGLASLEWDVAVSVRSRPASLVRSPGLRPDDPPERASVEAQPLAPLDGNHPSLQMTLEYGSPLVLTLSAEPSP